MSYDLELLVRVDGTDLFAHIASPEYSSPTYNLREMFVSSMNWDYKQGEEYRCENVIENIEQGIRKLRLYPEKYKQYESTNGWGTISNAIEVLESLRDCIYETAEYVVPINHLWMRW